MKIGLKHFKDYRATQLRRAILEGMPEYEANKRMRGRSTAMALRTISEAMLNPGRAIKIEDHINLHASRERLYEVVKEALENLGLECFVIDHGNMTIKYTLEYVYAGECGGV
jgi:hypothetical protein